MRTRWLTCGTLGAAVLALGIACGSPSSNTLAGPSAPGVSSAEIIGPDTLSPGQSAQYQARLRLGDGTVKIVTPASSVQWSTAFPSSLQVTASGLATAQQHVTETTLTAQVPTGVGSIRIRATKEIVIVPDGTYRLVGTVKDGEYPSVPVSGAHVEVSPGPVATTTDSGGRYRLYGVAADSEVRITRDGYVPFAENVHLTAHSGRDFQLTPSGPRLGLAGAYTLTLDAGGSCGSLPADLLRRSYDATIVQNGIQLEVRLTEPIFRLNGTGKGDRFVGQAGAGTATFTLWGYYNYYYSYYGPSAYPDVAERLSDGSVLVVDGNATVTGSAAGLTGTLNGSFNRWTSGFPTSGQNLGGCHKPTIQFSLTPR